MRHSGVGSYIAHICSKGLLSQPIKSAKYLDERSLVDLKLSNFLATNTEPINLCQHDFQKWQLQQPARNTTAKFSRAHFVTLGKCYVPSLILICSPFNCAISIFTPARFIATWRRESMEATEKAKAQKNQVVGRNSFTSHGLHSRRSARRNAPCVVNNREECRSGTHTYRNGHWPACAWIVEMHNAKPKPTCTPLSNLHQEPRNEPVIRFKAARDISGQPKRVTCPSGGCQPLCSNVYQPVDATSNTQICATTWAWPCGAAK